MPSRRDILLSALVPVAASAQPQVYEHRVKSWVARTGSHFTETVVWRSPYPFDRPLADLPEVAAAVMRRAIRSTDNTLQPPLPMRPMAEVFDSANSLPEQLGLSARLELFIDVDQEGRVSDVYKSTASPLLLVEKFSVPLHHMQFTPAKCVEPLCKSQFVYVAWFNRE